MKWYFYFHCKTRAVQFQAWIDSIFFDEVATHRLVNKKNGPTFAVEIEFEPGTGQQFVNMLRERALSYHACVRTEPKSGSLPGLPKNHGQSREYEHSPAVPHLRNENRRKAEIDADGLWKPPTA